jgi:hypothetical protein
MNLCRRHLDILPRALQRVVGLVFKMYSLTSHSNAWVGLLVCVKRIIGQHECIIELFDLDFSCLRGWFIMLVLMCWWTRLRVYLFELYIVDSEFYNLNMRNKG